MSFFYYSNHIVSVMLFICNWYTWIYTQIGDDQSIYKDQRWPWKFVRVFLEMKPNYPSYSFHHIKIFINHIQKHRFLNHVYVFFSLLMTTFLLVVMTDAILTASTDTFHYVVHFNNPMTWSYMVDSACTDCATLFWCIIYIVW